MKIKFVLAGAVLAGLAVMGTAIAANPKLNSFGPGDVSISESGTVTIVNEPGEYGGVYLSSRSQSGKLLGEVDFSFISTGDVAGGAPRFSIPIDTDGNGIVEGYAFLDAANCGGVSNVTTTVSTEALNCPVFLNWGPSFANWDAFAAAHPTYRIAPGAIPFIIADQPGTYQVSNIVLR